MELKDTVEGMLSDNYKERFKAEYYQLKIRIDRLSKIITSAIEGTLEFDLSCDLKILKDQCWYMKSYADMLKHRAKIEGIEL